MLVDGSVDRDGDLVDREWRQWSGGSFEVLSSNANHSLWLPPGTHHLSVYVQDARGSWAEDHVNITVQSSLPRFVAESLQVTPDEAVLGERTTLRIVGRPRGRRRHHGGRASHDHSLGDQSWDAQPL